MRLPAATLCSILEQSLTDCPADGCARTQAAFWNLPTRNIRPHRGTVFAPVNLTEPYTESQIRMQCFFSGEMLAHPDQPVTAGVVSFKIPDLDITFRAQFKGSAKECQYASLLALLEFVDLNPHLFKNKTLEIFSDSESVVRQVNNSQVAMTPDLEPYRSMAITYRRKYPYLLSLVSEGNNPALGNHSQPDT